MDRQKLDSKVLDSSDRRHFITKAVAPVAWQATLLWLRYHVGRWPTRGTATCKLNWERWHPGFRTFVPCKWTTITYANGRQGNVDPFVVCTSLRQWPKQQCSLAAASLHGWGFAWPRMAHAFEAVPGHRVH